MKNAIAWVDCEMTGLEIDRDAIIEVAVLITDAELSPLDDGIDLVIRPPEAALLQMIPLVREMHTASGLLDVLDDGISISEASAQLLEYTRGHVADARSVPLAGNSVWVDRRFLARDMPSFEQAFSHRVIDVSSVAELVTRWRPQAMTAMASRPTQHRALADIGNSISELGVYRRLLFSDTDSVELSPLA